VGTALAGSIVGAGIAAVYAVGLHRLPDWYAFVEYGLAYQAGAAFYPMTVLGAVWVLVLTFVACTTVTLAVLQQRRLRALPALLAACGAQWSTMSYFISRSHDNNVCNLIPLEITALAVVLYVVRREALDDAAAVFARCATVAVAAMTIGLAFSPTGIVSRYLEPTTERHARADVFPRIAPELSRLLMAVNVRPGGPLLYENSYVPPVWPDAPELMPRLWVPVYPPPEFGVLPQPREEIYVRRFAQRHREWGVLVQDSGAAPLPGAPPLRDVLRSAFAERLVAGGGRYTIYRYDPR